MLIRSVLFNFQGAFLNLVAFVCLSSLGDLIIISLSELFVKWFFKSFFEVFLIFFRSDVISEVSLAWFRKLFYYITSFRVCQEVFQTFFKVFSNHLGSFKRSDFLFESFYIISHCLSFVKRFSKLFSKFFVTFSLSLCPHLECLSIISPSPAKVNTFLKSFFHSLLMSYIFNSFSTIHSNMHCCTPFFTLFYLLYSRFFTNN